MTGLLEMFTRRGRREAARAQLFDLSRTHAWVQVEIESTPLRFWSKVLIRNELVVLNCHLEHEPFLRRKGWVRLRPDPKQPAEVRLQIESLRHGGSGPLATAVGRMALLCTFRSSETSTARRGEPRYFTGLHSDVRLELPPDHFAVPVLDLSPYGLKISIEERKAFSRFPLRLPQSHAVLQLGRKAEVFLASITPRHHHKKAVGLEMQVDLLGDSEHRLETFLNILRHEERHPGD